MTITTGISPAIAQASWNRVSNWAKARPRLACGASRWTMLSNARRPTAAAKLTATASTTPAATPPSSAAVIPATADRPSAPASITSSRAARRSRGEMALPTIVPSADSPTATANHAVPAVCVRSQKARRKNTKPTLARSTSIATAASCSPTECSCTRSAGCSGVAATTSAGSRVALARATAKNSPGVDQRPPAPGRRQLQQAGGDDGDEPGEPGDHAELGVGLDELGLGAHDRRHERLLRHEVGLLQDEGGEHQREQRQLSIDTAISSGQHDPGRGDELDHGPPPAGGPVDHRADQRGEQRGTGRS